MTGLAEGAPAVGPRNLAPEPRATPDAEAENHGWFRLDAPLVVALLFCWAVLGAAPSVDWLDSGHLVAAAWTMGVAHPPGEQAWLALAKLAQLVPVGDIAFRVNLLSGACVAACAWPLLRAAGPGTGQAPGQAGDLLVLAALSSLACTLQAVRAEVYGLVALLLLVALASALRPGSVRASASIGLLLGIGAGVHPLLCAAAIPALLVARICSGRVRLRDAGWLATSGLWGLASLPWLPLRALAVPGRAFGLPDSPARFADVLLARTFARNFGGEQVQGIADNLAVVLRVWGRAGLPVLALLGIAACLRVRSRAPVPRARSLLLVAALWLAGSAATVLPQNKVFETNPDLLGYLAIGVLGTVPLAILGLGRVGRPRTLLCAALLGGLALDGTLAFRSDSHAARSFAVEMAAGLPPGAILVPSGNDTAFLWTYMSAVERRRDDLVVLPRVLLGHRHELARLGGELALADLGIPWTPDLRSDPVPALRESERPAYVEVREPEIPWLDRGLIRSHGLVGGPGTGLPEGPWLAEIRDRVLDELAGQQGDSEAELVRLYFMSLRTAGPAAPTGGAAPGDAP